jgi:hypothetical protein
MVLKAFIDQLLDRIRLEMCPTGSDRGVALRDSPQPVFTDCIGIVLAVHPPRDNRVYHVERIRRADAHNPRPRRLESKTSQPDSFHLAQRNLSLCHNWPG